MTEENVNQHWPQLSLLDVLRPSPCWLATDVVLSTYSLDLVVLVSVLLALTDRDKLDGGGSKVGLATAIDHFRPRSNNRLSLLVQSGRISTPRITPTVLALLDRFVKEVRRDQRQKSWHAKVALVRFETDVAKQGEKSVEWRVWIGSRNLSRDTSWDTGLVMSGVVGENGVKIDGLESMAVALLVETGWEEKRKKKLLNELENMRWKVPQRVQVKSVTWLDNNKWRPTLLSNSDKVAVITPFFDHKALAKVAAAGTDAKKYLLTTQVELDRQARGTQSELDTWDVFCLDSSEQAERLFAEHEKPDIVAKKSGHEEWGSDDEEMPMGLHAKIIASLKANKVQLFMGSANITTRAWDRNTELIVELEGDKSLWNGIEALMLMANHAQIPASTNGKTPTSLDWLGTFRNALCNLKLNQSVKVNFLEVSADIAPQDILQESERLEWDRLNTKLEIAPLAASRADYLQWPLKQRHIALPLREHTLAGDTEFMQFRLVCEADPNNTVPIPARLSWVQCVPLNPAPGDDRDRRILASYLSPAQFLSWIHGMLAGYEVDSEPWDHSPRKKLVPGKARGGTGRAAGMPSIEAVLKAWQRDSSVLTEVSETIDRYFDSEKLKKHYTADNDHQSIKELSRFYEQLKQMVRVLRNK